MRLIDVEPLEDKLKEHIRKTESELMLGALSTFPTSIANAWKGQTTYHENRYPYRPFIAPSVLCE